MLGRYVVMLIWLGDVVKEVSGEGRANVLTGDKPKWRQ